MNADGAAIPHASWVAGAAGWLGTATGMDTGSCLAASSRRAGSSEEMARHLPPQRLMRLSSLRRRVRDQVVEQLQGKDLVFGAHYACSLPERVSPTSNTQPPHGL